MNDPAPNRTRGLAGVTAAALVGNVFSYLLLVVAAGLLPTHDYSSFIALMNVALVGSIAAFALQVVTARRVATAHGDGVRSLAFSLSGGVSLLLLALTPLELRFLHLDGLTAAVLMALSLPGSTVLGMCQGAWQGSQRFTALAWTTFAAVAGRTGPALVMLLVFRTATTAMAGLALGAGVTAIVCYRALPATILRAGPALLPSSSLVHEVAHAAHAYGVFLALSVADVLLASHVLPTRPAAIYAAGSVMTKAALWLPQSAATVLFADLTDLDRHRGLLLRAVAALSGLGLILVAGSWAVHRLVAAVVGGGSYPELGADVWLFAALGSCLAMLQFLLISGLAIRSRRVTAVVWLAIGAECVAVLTRARPSVHGIIATVVVVNLVAVGVALLLRYAHRDLDRNGGQLLSSPGHGPGENTAS